MLGIISTQLLFVMYGRPLSTSNVGLQDGAPYIKMETHDHHVLFAVRTLSSSRLHTYLEIT